MLRSRTLLAAGLMLGATLLLVGCQSSNDDDMSGESTAMRSGGSTTQPSDRAQLMSEGVMCPKCQATYVRTPIVVPSYEGPRVVGYFSKKGPKQCSECKKHAEEYFSTGKLPKCSTCGDLEVTEAM